MLNAYRVLAELRYYTRIYMSASSRAAALSGVTDQQYLLLLTIAGMPDGMKTTVGNLAKRMLLAHNSTVSLIDRTEQRGLVIRHREPADRRYVLVSLTPAGEDLLKSLARFHYQELQNVAPGIVEELQKVLATTDWREAFTNSEGTAQHEN